MIKNYNELPLGRYMDIVAATTNEEDPLARQVTTIAILNGMTEEAVLSLPLAEYRELAAAAAFLERPCPERLLKVADTYRLDKWELKPTKDFRHIITAQYVDYLGFVKDAEHNVPQILSCFLIPKGCKYNEGYDILEVQQAIRDNITVADALALAAFFLRKYTDSIKGSLAFSRRLLKGKKGTKAEMLRQEAERLTALVRNGDGSPTSTR